jgi:hypothetical protein
MVPMKRHAPATDRNRIPILGVLERIFRTKGMVVLEVASGSGEHAVFFSEKLPHVIWQPSDIDAEALGSIEAWRAECRLPNLRPPVTLDATSSVWPVKRASAVVCINMLHISPPDACRGLFVGAAAVLPWGSPFFLYGPFKVYGEHTAPSNAQFDADLRKRNPAWGVRNLDDVIAEAAACGFAHEETVTMPANNLSVVFRRK